MLVSNLVTEVGETFRSYVREQSPSTALSGSLTNVDTTFTVDDGTQVSKGLAEIEDELVYVRSVDRSSGDVTLEPWGRGQSGTTAVSHSSGARVTSSPTYPRGRMRDVISGVLQEIFPKVFPVGTGNISPNGSRINYDLPADTYSLLAVEYNPPGPTQSWVPIPRWRQNRTNLTVELELLTRVTPGVDRVRVFYVKTPPPQLAFTDDLETMGYPVSTRELIVLGACSRLAAFTETSRVQSGRVENIARAEAVPAGSALSLSRYLYQLFSSRLESEATKLQSRYPTVVHYTR